MPYKVGTHVAIAKDHLENYPECEGRKLIVTDYSNSGFGYDRAVYPSFLYDVSGVGFDFNMSLYGFELIRTKKK